MNPSENWLSFVSRCNEGQPDFLRTYIGGERVYPSGLAALDDALNGGFHAGVNLIGGAPGTFKTGICVSIFEFMAQMGYTPIYLTLEMSFQNIMMRMLASYYIRNWQTFPELDGLQAIDWSGRRPYYPEIDNAEPSSYEWENGLMDYEKKFRTKDPVVATYYSMQERLKDQFVILDRTKKIDSICEMLRAITDNGIKTCVFVDYIQQIEVEEPKDDLADMGEISGKLTEVARDCDIPVIAISAISKQAMKGGTPDITWFRGTGNLGYDSTSAMILTDDIESFDLGGYENVNPPIDTARLWIVKSRHSSQTDFPIWTQKQTGFVTTTRRNGYGDQSS